MRRGTCHPIIYWFESLSSKYRALPPVPTYMLYYKELFTIYLCARTDYAVQME